MFTKYKVAEMNPKQLRKMQLLQLEMLIELDRICRKYSIKYIIESGTLLGAVRNRRFIPWDDDIDVGMLRSEYKRFCEVCKVELPDSCYFLQNGETDSQYRWGYAKLIHLNSSYIRLNQEHLKMKQCMFIDIFPMDGVPNDIVSRKIQSAICFCMRKLSWSEVGKLHANNPLKRLVYRGLSLMPKQLPNRVFLLVSKIWNEVKYDSVRVLAYDDYQSLKREWYIDLKEINFEEHLFYAPKDTHGWLSGVYGEEYIIPPPEGQRIGASPASKYSFP